MTIETRIDAATGAVTVIDDRTPEQVAADALGAERAGMVVSRFQAKAALDAAGLLASAESAVTAAGGTALLAWNEAVEFRRNSPTIAGLAGALGLSDTDLDDLFRSAAMIEA